MTKSHLGLAEKGLHNALLIHGSYSHYLLLRKHVIGMNIFTQILPTSHELRRVVGFGALRMCILRLQLLNEVMLEHRTYPIAARKTHTIKSL